MVRALGRGSVSSVLKAALDVFYVALVIGAALIGVAILIVLLLSFRPDLLESQAPIEALREAGPAIGPVAALVLLALDAYVGGGIVIVGRLRRIFRSLIDGDPFHPANVRRLNVIAATLAILEVGRYLAAFVSRLAFHGRFAIDADVSLSAWFSILIVVVLAEVFREGARLRRDAELTI